MSPEARKQVGGKVVTPQGNPIAHATVEITSLDGGPFKALVTDNDGEFVTEYDFLNDTAGKHVAFTLKVNRKGFQIGRRFVDMPESVNNVGLRIILRPVVPEDPTLLSQADLIQGVAPRLRQLGAAGGLTDKEEKVYARGLEEFLDRGHPEKAVPDFVRVVNLRPACLKCKTMLALCELTWGDWDDARHELMDSVNAILLDPKLGASEPLLADGVMASWRHEYAKAAAYFREALKYAPDDPLALQELGRAECQQLDWYDGSESLKKALAAGAGREARLLRAEALVQVGTLREAHDELNLYMNGGDFKSMPPRARAVWTQIQQREKDNKVVHAAALKAQARGIEPLDYLHNPPRNLPDFEPATDQAPLEAILAAVGKNVADLFANLPNICSIEKVQQEKLNGNGKTTSARQYQFRYLALAPDHPWGPSVDEYRANGRGDMNSPMDLSEDGMLTEGFVSAPLIFHPAYQSGSSFRLLGRQKVKGRSTFVLAYAQVPAKNGLSGTFAYGTTTKLTYTQGLAWIDAGNYQVVRITSDLLTPIPEVRLDKETTDINFSEVQFKRLTRKFWLPEAVTVTLDWNGRTYRNNHAYSEFLVSKVESTQRIGKPKGAEKTEEKTIEPAPANNPLEKQSLSLVPSPKKP
jgi:tetratricopeptide (TPR) repeat protein